MRLTGLEPLYRSMRAQGMGRVKFRYVVNHLTFECLFFIDQQPFELVMGCLGHNFAIFKQVHRGFEIDVYLGDLYDALRKALFTNAGSNIKLEPGVFFAEFNQDIPTHTAPHHAVTTDDVYRYYPDLEEADKRWFCGWRDNTVRGKKVSPENLEKTRRLMGQRAHDFALRRNQSTCWTPDRSRAKEFHVPE